MHTQASTAYTPLRLHDINYKQSLVKKSVKIESVQLNSYMVLIQRQMHTDGSEVPLLAYII